MTPHEMLGLLDDAIGVAERTGKRRKDLILDMVGSPTVIDQIGVPVDGKPGEYSFSLRQCRNIRKTILKAARHDAKQFRARR